MCDYMELGINEARKTMNQNLGGPFGAVIVRDGDVVAVASNRVLGDNDPTAHAEVEAIRRACSHLGTHDLSGCEIYSTGYPCPMCLGAIIWANIKTCHYGCRPSDADSIGFRDDFIYDFIKGGNSDGVVLELDEFKRGECLELFKEYAEKGKEIY